MVSRQIIRPGQQDDVPPHEHDATEVSGVHNFLRTLNALISGTLRSEGYDPNTVGGEGWELTRAGAATLLGQVNIGSNVVPQVLFVRAETSHINLVETDATTTDVWVLDANGGVGRFGLLDLTGPTYTQHLEFNQDGTVEFPQGVNADTAHVIKVAGSEVARFTADGLELSGEPVGVWQDWTPTYTNLTVSNGTVVARYTQAGKKVSFRYELTFGSSTSISGDVRITLPVTAASSGYLGLTSRLGDATFLDSGTANYAGVALYDTTGQMAVRRLDFSSGSTVRYFPISGTVPFTWTTGDVLYAAGTYEAA